MWPDTVRVTPDVTETEERPFNREVGEVMTVSTVVLLIASHLILTESPVT